MVFSLSLAPHALAGHGHSSKHMLSDKLSSKAHFFYMNQEALGLTEEQVESIKALKMEVKKELVKRKADIKLVKIDIKSLLWQKDVDVDAINALIDKKYEIKKAKAKYLVSSYAKLKGMLTEEQMAKAKAIWFKTHR